MIKTKPAFPRENAHRKRRVSKKGWRSPKGTDSKKRRGKKHQGARPNIGYGTGKKAKEILIWNTNDLLKLSENAAAKIGSSVGKRKRAEISKKAAEKKVKILNE